MPMNTERFASIVAARRSELGLTQQEVANAGGPSDTTQRKIESAESVNVSPQTLRKYDLALQWREASAATTLAGGDPTPASTSAQSHNRPAERDTAPTLFAYGGDAGHNPLTPYADSTLRSAERLLDIADGIPHDMGPGPETLVDDLLDVADGIVSDVARYSAHFADGESFAYVQDRIRAVTTRHATISIQRGRAVSIGTGELRPIVDGKLRATSNVSERVVEDMPTAARRGRGKTKGEQLRDRDAQLGEESQIDPTQED